MRPLRSPLAAHLVLLSLLLLASCSTSEDDPPGCWAEVPLPPVDAPTAQLNGIHALSERDVWAVGQMSVEGGGSVPLAMRWDGTQWGIVPVSVPSSPGSTAHLYAVSGTSPGDVWAVGVQAEPGRHFRGLAMRWDGAEWRAIETPDPGELDTILNDVAAVSPQEVWVVGSYSDTEHEDPHTMILRWDGNHWQEADLSEMHTHSLLAVDASGGTAWAVGTEMLRGQGDRWEQVPVPDGVSGAYYDGVAVDGERAWAVGNDGDRAVGLFWNGETWSGGTTPQLAGGPYPHDLALLSDREVWAVGEYAADPLERQLLLLRWDGAEWRTAPNPLPGRDTRLMSITRAGDTLWAAGAQGRDSESRPLVIRYTCTESKK